MEKEEKNPHRVAEGVADPAKSHPQESREGKEGSQPGPQSR